MGNFGFDFFVGNVTMRLGFCLFGPLHVALGPNSKWEIFAFFKKKH